MFSQSRTILSKSSNYARVIIKVNLNTSSIKLHTVKKSQTLVQQSQALRRAFATVTQSGSAKLLERARTAITDDIKKEINAVFVFNISGKQYLMDAHSSRPLKLEEVSGQLPEKVDVTMITDEDTFMKLAKGEMKPTSAFMTGKMKIKGDMSKAMKAQKVFKAMKV